MVDDDNEETDYLIFERHNVDCTHKYTHTLVSVNLASFCLLKPPFHVDNPFYTMIPVRCWLYEF